MMYIDSVRVPSVMTRRNEVEVPLFGVVDARRVLFLSSVTLDCRGFRVHANTHTHAGPFTDHAFSNLVVLFRVTVVLC